MTKYKLYMQNDDTKVLLTFVEGDIYINDVEELMTAIEYYCTDLLYQGKNPWCVKDYNYEPADKELGTGAGYDSVELYPIEELIKDSEFEELYGNVEHLLNTIDYRPCN